MVATDSTKAWAVAAGSSLETWGGLWLTIASVLLAVLGIFGIALAILGIVDYRAFKKDTRADLEDIAQKAVQKELDNRTDKDSVGVGVARSNQSNRGENDG